MRDAPERIWIDAWGGNWSSRGDGTQQIEYVRSDIHRSLALDALAAYGQAADAHAAQLKAEAIAAKLAEALRELHMQSGKRANDLGGYDKRFPLRKAIDESAVALAEYEASK